MQTNRTIELLHWSTTSELESIISMIYRIHSRLLRIYRTTDDPDTLIMVEYNLKTIRLLLSGLADSELRKANLAIDSLGA